MKDGGLVATELTLRDYFAARALEGLVASNLYDRAKQRQEAFRKGHDAAFVTETSDASEMPLTHLAAALAYEYADAMLEARGKE